MKLLPSKPVSAGVFLSYKCPSKCRHCMYACSPAWGADWISKGDLERVLVQLSSSIISSPLGPGRVGINYGLHFTGGEPFLNFELLVEGVEMAEGLGIPSLFVETNSFWCSDDGDVREKFVRLKKAGLNGVLISVNPFILEQVPFERTVRAIKVGREVFGGNLLIYQDFFRRQFEWLRVNGRLPFEEYL
ncbi:MAG: radical SAM protein, partial [Candidatus Freyarchaeota archaeon]|nr:radical SAM protein [Candidatus Jordarchaeia archaeon]